MKLALLLLAVLPFAFSMSVEDRSIFSHLGFPHVLDIGFIRTKVQEILDKLGSDGSEQQCEDTCHTSLNLAESHLIHTLCTPLCRSFQTLVSLFNLRPQPTSGS